MPLEILRNDITKMKVDAIVNAANESLLGGGVDGAIHAAAGPQLLAECRTLGGCKTGMAKITKGYRLPAKYVIHTVGPIWHGGAYGEKQLLESCYKNSLELAKAWGCETVAYPLISAGVYGYPKDQAIRVATNAIADFLMENDMMVYLVVFNHSAFEISNQLFHAVQSYIDDNYVDRHTDWRIEQRRRMEQAQREAPPVPFDAALCPHPAAPKKKPKSLDEALGQIDESFSQAVLRLIQEKCMKNSTCYKKANLDKKLFPSWQMMSITSPRKPLP